MATALTEEISLLLGNIAIFGGLTPKQQSDLLSLMDERIFADGEQIFKKDDVASNIYIVIEGQVALDFEQDDHPLSDILINPGFCFGETSLIGVQPHSASTFAKGTAKTLLLSGTKLFGLYESDIKLFSLLIMNIAREASRRLHTTDEMFLKYCKDDELKKLSYLGF